MVSHNDLKLHTMTKQVFFVMKMNLFLSRKHFYKAPKGRKWVAPKKIHNLPTEEFPLSREGNWLKNALNLYRMSPVGEGSIINFLHVGGGVWIFSRMTPITIVIVGHI